MQADHMVLESNFGGTVERWNAKLDCIRAMSIGLHYDGIGRHHFLEKAAFVESDWFGSGRAKAGRIAHETWKIDSK